VRFEPPLITRRQSSIKSPPASGTAPPKQMPDDPIPNAQLCRGYGWVRSSPCNHVKKLKTSIDYKRRKLDGNILTWPECLRLFEAAGTLRDRARLRMAVETGMRQGELLGLRWGRCRLDQCACVRPQFVPDAAGHPGKDGGIDAADPADQDAAA
jgi:hypothetical protein